MNPVHLNVDLRTERVGGPVQLDLRVGSTAPKGVTRRQPKRSAILPDEQQGAGAGLAKSVPLRVSRPPAYTVIVPRTTLGAGPHGGKNDEVESREKTTHTFHGDPSLLADPPMPCGDSNRASGLSVGRGRPSTMSRVVLGGQTTRRDAWDAIETKPFQITFSSASHRALPGGVGGGRPYPKASVAVRSRLTSWPGSLPESIRPGIFGKP